MRPCGSVPVAWQGSLIALSQIPQLLLSFAMDHHSFSQETIQDLESDTIHVLRLNIIISHHQRDKFGVRLSIIFIS